MKWYVKVLSFSFLGLLVFVVGWIVASKTSSGTADNLQIQTYSAQGIVEKIATDHHAVTIHHQAIPGYMMEMTMDFTVKESEELEDLTPGDKINFSLVVSPDQEWVEHLRRTGHVDEKTNSLTKTMPEGVLPKLQPGDKFPDAEIFTEEGSKIHLADFQGKALALTFFFTRCPLPDYCPRMNRNFAQTRTLLLTKTGARTNWQLLSLSFDSSFDQPQILRGYAGLYRGESTEHWLFASASSEGMAIIGPRVGLMLMREENNISHNLRTVVLDTHGRLYRQFNDNEWTPQQLAETILQAANH